MPSLPSTQQVWFQTKRASYTDAIELNPSAPIPALEPGHVLVKVSNVALNPVGYKTMGMLPSFVRKLPCESFLRLMVWGCGLGVDLALGL